MHCVIQKIPGLKKPWRVYAVYRDSRDGQHFSQIAKFRTEKQARRVVAIIEATDRRFLLTDDHICA